jgi:hypothetical protein
MGPQRLGRLDRQHVAQAVGFQPGAQAGVAAVDLVGGHPPSGHLGVQGALEHGLGELRLGVEGDPLGHVRLGAAGGVGGPFLGQVELPVDQRPPLRLA